MSVAYVPPASFLEDVQQLLAVIAKPRDRAMILVLLRTAMRIGELLATRMSVYGNTKGDHLARKWQ